MEYVYNINRNSSARGYWLNNTFQRYSLLTTNSVRFSSVDKKISIARSPFTRIKDDQPPKPVGYASANGKEVNGNSLSIPCLSIFYIYHLWEVFF
jgi:hypothetical protein